MINLPRSPLRFIMFLAVMGVLLIYAAVKWGDVQMQTLRQVLMPQTDIEMSEPHIVLPVKVGDRDDAGEPAEPGDEPATETASGEEPDVAATADGRDDGDDADDGATAAGAEAQQVVSERSLGEVFAAQRVLRDRNRSAQIEMLQTLAATEGEFEPAMREEAERALLELSERMTQEAEIEAIVRARGFADALVYLYDQAAVIVVPADEMDSVTAGQLADAVVKVAGIPYTGISIMLEPES